MKIKEKEDERTTDAMGDDVGLSQTFNLILIQRKGRIVSIRRSFLIVICS